MVIRLPENRDGIHFGRIISLLNHFSLRRILIEGGGETIAQAMKAKVVTEMLIFVAPKVIGGRRAITPVGGAGVRRIMHAISLSQFRTEKSGPDLLIVARPVWNRTAKIG